MVVHLKKILTSPENCVTMKYEINGIKIFERVFFMCDNGLHMEPLIRC